VTEHTSTVAEAIERMRDGGSVLLRRSGPRPTSGVIAMSARATDGPAIERMAVAGYGLVCVAMEEERLLELGVPPMETTEGGSAVALHVGVDWKPVAGCISAADRAATVRALADPAASASDFVRPGRVFPIACPTAPLGEEPSLAAATLWLARLADLPPAVLLCEVEVDALRDADDVPRATAVPPTVTVADLRRELEQAVTRVEPVCLPLPHGRFDAIGYLSAGDGSEHLALLRGRMDGTAPVHVEVECIAGHVFHSTACDCRTRLIAAFEEVDRTGEGTVLYIRAPHPDHTAAHPLAGMVGGVPCGRSDDAVRRAHRIAGRIIGDLRIAGGRREDRHATRALSAR